MVAPERPAAIGLAVHVATGNGRVGWQGHAALTRPARPSDIVAMLMGVATVLVPRRVICRALLARPGTPRTTGVLPGVGVGSLSGQTTAVTVVCFVFYLALTRREGETSQQRQGARPAEETGQ
ncbi:hypothetical protein Taro_003349 [Colocasia esculenta]|uniref:Uncharacterized protein n=1 Tax=Colocasia esculenta TaxID=4460 RepID=A0A843TJH6_COLES|nr:hypothetical protein [Colocasia esculenta]